MNIIEMAVERDRWFEEIEGFELMPHEANAPVASAVASHTTIQDKSCRPLQR